MALQVGTVDGLINIGPKITDVFVKAIAAFAEQGVEYARSKGIPFGAAFQRFTYPVYSGEAAEFNETSIDKPVYTKSGKEQSPAFITYCRKMGLLIIDESKSLFKLTTIGELLLNNEITLQEYAFVIISKQGIFQDGVYKAPLLAPIVELFEAEPSITTEEIQSFISKSYNDSEIWKTRFDILLGALATSGLLVKDNNTYYIGGLPQARILEDIKKNINKISPSLLDDDENYSTYMGECTWGIFDIILHNNIHIYEKLFPNLVKYSHLSGNIHASICSHNINQIIYYGAPGTGKSHEVAKTTKQIESETKANHEEERVFRTTFHPDSDYSTFVGCYKPTMQPEPQTYVVEGQEKPVVDKDGKQVMKEKIVYNFIPQAFTNAYVRAWQTDKDVYLVIEEINRGNCAQIFGDLFQLLDRDKDGYSKYPIDTDSDLGNHICKALLASERNDIPEDVKSGKKMQLPSNLYIWATMNTSDQSLFPIDSAFKRRWDWKYMKIKDMKDKIAQPYQIIVKDKQYSWWGFISKMNEHIASTASSEDKQLGYFFVNREDGKISADDFVNKVLFYLYNDALKDYLVGLNVKNEQGELKAAKFSDFYDDNGEVITEKVQEALDDYIPQEEEVPADE